MCTMYEQEEFVGQALVANMPTRRNRQQEGSGKNDRTKGVAGKCVSGGAAATKNDNRSTIEGERKYDDLRNKCHRYLEPGHRWFDCIAGVIPTATTPRTVLVRF